jgi:hypothetical protein
MRVMESVIFVSVLSCVVLTMPLYGVEITPSNVVRPSLPGETFGFDFVIKEPGGVTGTAFGSWISVSGPGTLTFDATASEAVATTDTSYWLYGHSDGAFANDEGNNEYSFGDNPDPDLLQKTLVVGDIMARYVFTWDGTVGDYTFSLDLLDTDKNFIDHMWATQALQFAPGEYPGDDSSFTVTIPEPATLMLLGLGSLVLLRKQRGLNKPANKFGGGGVWVSIQQEIEDVKNCY